MFFRKWIFKSNALHKRLKINEFNKLILKSLLVNADFNNYERFYFNRLFINYPKSTSVSIFKRFCLLTGYPKSVFKYFKLSRHQCKRLSSDGILLGMRKSSF